MKGTHINFMGQKGGRDHLTAVMAGSESSRFVYCGQAPLPVCGYHLHGWRGSSNGFSSPGFLSRTVQPWSWWPGGGFRLRSVPSFIGT